MHGCIAYRIMCHLDHANHNARRLQGWWLGVGMAHHGCGGRRSRRPLGDGKGRGRVGSHLHESNPNPTLNITLIRAGRGLTCISLTQTPNPKP